MKKQVLFFLLTLIGLSGVAQTYTKLPADAKPYGNQLYIRPNGEIISGLGSALFRAVDTKTRVDSLLVLKTDQTQTVYKSTRAEVRSFTGALKSSLINITDTGLEGTFYYDPSDTTTPDNSVSVIVTADGKRLKRPGEATVKAWWYGLKGDGVTNDQVAFQNMLQAVPNQTSIDFGNRKYVFNRVNLKNKDFIRFIGNGAEFTGTVIVGDTSALAPIQMNCNFGAQGISFVHSGFVKNCFEFANIRGFYLSDILARGSNAILYIRPIDKFQHVAQGSIRQSHGETNYLFYADNPINVAPYTGLQMTTADIEISSNADHTSRISSVLGFGVDGLLVSDNIFFMTSNFFRSQIKNQTVRIVGGNWISVNNNQMFESGLEGCLFELCRNFTINNNRFAWSGQRDVNFGYGIRITGGGFPNVNYTNGTISNNNFDRCTRSSIKLDALSARLKISGNQSVSTGNGQFYYGTSLYVPGVANSGDPNALPAINSVGHYSVDVDANTKYCSVNDNTDDNADYLFGYNESLPISITERLIHYNNYGISGAYEELSTEITTLAADGKINTNGKNIVNLNVTNGVVKDIINARVGDKVTFYNKNASSLTMQNTATIQLLNSRNAVIESTNTIVLQKRSDKWYEISRGGNDGLKVLATSGSDAITPLVAQGNSDTQIAPLMTVRNSALQDQVNVEADGALSLEEYKGANKDLKFKYNGIPQFIVRMTNSVDHDLQILSRETATGAFKEIMQTFYKASGNVAFGDIGSDIPTAKIAVNSTTKGFLPPRLNLTQRDAIVNPSEGLEIYNLNAKKPSFYNGVAWENVLSSLTFTSSLDFPNTPASQSAILTVAATGVAVGDAVVVVAPDSLLSTIAWNFSFVAWVSSVNTVSVKFLNQDPSTAHDIAAASFTLKVLK
jgi:hypothetical protein